MGFYFYVEKIALSNYGNQISNQIFLTHVYISCILYFTMSDIVHWCTLKNIHFSIKMWYKSLIWIIAPSLIYFSMFQCKHTIKFKKNRTFLHCHKIELGVKKLKLFVFELLFCLFFQSSFLQVNYFLSNQIYPTINCGLSLAYQ